MSARRTVCMEPGCDKPRFALRSGLNSRCKAHYGIVNRARVREARERKLAAKLKNIPNNDAMFPHPPRRTREEVWGRIELKRSPPGNPNRCTNGRIGESPDDLIREAKLRRIARDGPSNNDSKADVDESGWGGGLLQVRQ